MKFAEMHEKLANIFVRGKKNHDDKLLAFRSMATKLESYLDYSEKAFELEIYEGNIMIKKQLLEMGNFVDINPDDFNFN